MNQNKKRLPKLTLAGKLLVILVVLLAISIASSLYNNEQQRSNKQDLKIVISDADAIKESIKDLKSEVYAIHDHLIREQQVNDWVPYENFNVCDPDATFKSWMDYETITDESSKQYELQQRTSTDHNGIKTTWERSHIAIANFDVGDMLNIQLLSGEYINAIVADVKNTDCTHPDGSMIEFVVDSSRMNPEIKRSGNFNDIFNGPILTIERVGNYFKEFEN